VKGGAEMKMKFGFGKSGYAILGILGLLGVAVQARAGDCEDAYLDRVTKLERILTPARWTSINAGAGALITQGVMASTGAITLAGAVTGGGAFVGTVGSYIAINERFHSLLNVMNTYKKAKADDLVGLLPIQSKIEKRFGRKMDLKEIAHRVRDAMENGDLCKDRRRGIKPIGFSAFLKMIGNE
jgi:hypothetical protein